MGLEPSTFMICVAKTPLQERDEAQHDGGRRRGVNAADLLDLVPQPKRELGRRAGSSRTARASDHVRRDGSRHPRRLEDKAPHAFDVETGGGDRCHRFPIGMAASSE